MARLVIDQMALPCTALLRVYSARTSFEEWVATPLIMHDAE